MKIYVKSLFNGWREAPEAQAKKFCYFLYNSMTTRINKIEYINTRIKGATAERLLNLNERN